MAPDEESVRGALGPRTERGPLKPARLFEDYGYRPRYDLEAGLARYVEWLQVEGVRA